MSIFDDIRSIGQVAIKDPKRFGTALGNTIKIPLENKRLAQEQKTAQLLADTGRLRQSRGADGSNYFNSAQRITQNAANQQMTLADLAKQTRRDAVGGGVGTALTILGAGNMPTSTAIRGVNNFRNVGLGLNTLGRMGSVGAIGTGINTGISMAMNPKANVKDVVRQSAIQSFGNAPKYAGVNSLTNPLISKYMNGVNPTSLKARMLAGGGSNALANVAEDELLKYTDEGRFMNPSETLGSAGTGFVFGAATQVKPTLQAKKAADESMNNILSTLRKSTPGEIQKANEMAKIHYETHKTALFPNTKKYSADNANAIGRIIGEYETNGRISKDTRRELEEIISGHIKKANLTKMSDDFLVREAFYQVNSQIKQGGFIKPDEFFGSKTNQPQLKTEEPKIKAEEQPNIIKTRNQAIKERLVELGADPKKLKVLDQNIKENKAILEKTIYGSETPEKTAFGGTKEGAGLVTDKLRAVQEDISTSVGKLNESPSPVVRNVGRLLQGFAGGLGKTQEEVGARNAYLGGLEESKQVGGDFEKYVQETLGKDEKSLNRVWAVLDPERGKGKYSELSDAEKGVADFARTVNDFINDLNYKNGFISKENWEANKGGKYIARAYEEFDYPPEVTDFLRISKGKYDLNAFYKRTLGVDVPEDLTQIKDPGYLIGKRLQQTMFNDSLKKMTTWMNSTDMVSTKPKDGYVKIAEHKMYGDLSGKWVRKDTLEDIKGFFYTSDTAQKMYDIVSLYDGNIIRRSYKKLFTVMNPAVRVANKTSNYVFAWLTGIDPVTYKKNLSFANDEVKGQGQLYRRMLRDGLLRSDITKADITRMATELKAGIDDPGILKKFDDMMVSGYGKTDDMAKISAMKTFLDRGYSYDEAARRVTNGFQNYHMVGWLYDVGAKIPVLGNPFVRFKGDLNRILKNGMIEHPIRTMSTVMAVKLLTDLTSRASGETPEDKQTREGRFGSPHIPFTNVSLAVQTPWGEVNAARLLGPYGTNYAGDNNMSDLADMMPIKNPFDKKSYASAPDVGPLVSLATDSDFRGKSIKDPNVGWNGVSNLTPEEQRMNRAKYLQRSYSPPVLNSVEDVASAMKGEPNFYGQVKTPTQAALRLYPGIKVEQFNAPEAQAQRARDDKYAQNKNDQLQRQITSIKKDVVAGELDPNVGQKRIAYLQSQLKTVGSQNVDQVNAGGSLVIPSDKEGQKILKDVIKDKIDTGKASDQELQYYYFYKGLTLPNSNRYEKAIKDGEIWAGINNIKKNENLTPEQQARMVGMAARELGITPADVEYKDIAKKSNDIKTLHILDEFDKVKTPEQRMDILIKGRKNVDGSILVSNGVIDNLVDDGYITYAEGQLLKKLEVGIDGKVKKTGRIGGTASKAKSLKTIKSNMGIKEFKSKKITGGNMGMPTLSSIRTNKISAGKLL
jgi:hypothetical protein